MEDDRNEAGTHVSRTTGLVCLVHDVNSDDVELCGNAGEIMIDSMCGSACVQGRRKLKQASYHSEF